MAMLLFITLFILWIDMRIYNTGVSYTRLCIFRMTFFTN